MWKTILWSWAGPGILFLFGIGVELMPNIQSWLWSGIVWGTALLWLLVVLVYRQRHRNGGDLEVRITPSKYVGSNNTNPYYGITPGQSLGAHFGLALINHNTEKAKHIESASLSLKKRTFLGNKTLFSVPVTYYAQPENLMLKNTILDPQKKLDVSVNVYEPIPVVVPFPRRSKLVLVLKLIGSTRNIEYDLDRFKHDPKLVPDIPD